MKNAILINAVLGITMLVPAVGAAAVSMNEPTRDKNSLGFSPESDEEWKILINEQDCRENLEIQFKITDTSSSGDLYLVVGESDNCNTEANFDDDECYLIDDIVAGLTFSVKIRELLEMDGPEACSGEDSRYVRAASLKDSDSAEGEWSTQVVTIDFDMDPPEAPTGIEAAAGEKKVKISWDTGETDDAGEASEGLDEDVNRILVLYDSTFSTEAVETGEDDTEQTADAGVDTSSDTEMAFRALAVDTENDNEGVDTAEDTSPRECTESGGFEEGTSYSPAFKKKSTNTPSTGEFSVTGLTNGTFYRFSVVALDEHHNPSKLSEVVCSTPDRTIDFFDAYTDAGGKGGKFCFVATATFGSYDHPMVQLLRAFRDRFLAELPGGNGVIAAYYDIGPDLAEIVADRPVLKGAAKLVLSVAAVLSVPFSIFGPLGMLLITITFISTRIIISRRRRK